MTAFDDRTRARLEREALVPYLMQQRWFGGKAREIASARFHDWAPLPSPSTSGVLTIVDVTYDGDAFERYQLPLVERDDGLLHDAVEDDAACRALAHAVQRNLDLPAARGTIAARSYSAELSADPDLAVTRLPGVHSNSALVLGDRYVLKLFRRVEAGINPDVEIGRFLARNAPHVCVPRFVGSIEYRKPEELPCTLALVQTLVPSSMTGWEHATGELQRFLADARSRRDDPTPAIVRDAVGDYGGSVALLGQRTAELHRALASSTDDPDFAPEHAPAAEIARQTARARRDADDVLDVLSDGVGALDDEARPLAEAVLNSRDTIGARLEELGRQTAPYVKIRVHGDYHLGQVLRVGDDFVIIDFEGEPARSLAERRAKQSPLRDVAGMLRSFGYVAEMALATADRTMRTKLRAWSRAWEASCADAFLRAYLDAARGAIFMPGDAAQVHRPLALFTIEKAVYELRYELNNRPQWISIPLAGILHLLDPASAS
jgi:trehalose synthase-fused probable maltokinase